MLNGSQQRQLRLLARTKSPKEVMQIMGISKGSMQHYCRVLGIKFQTEGGRRLYEMKLTIEDYQTIMDSYGEVSAKFLSKKFGVCVAYIWRIWRGGTTLQGAEPHRFDWENVDVVREYKGLPKLRR